MNGFTVIDNKTGTYPDCEKIALEEEWAKHLVYCDIDTFAVTEDGSLILMDDCGNCAFCPDGRFTIIGENEMQQEVKQMYYELYCAGYSKDDFFSYKESSWLIRHIKQRRGRGPKRTRRKSKC